ncbi:conditioned medium-induced protein 4 [Haladaptatus pallidirubidus]|uniref:Conditioned medium-induced protein 4 n=1 Tax=Haladaptatus pallidirubidus TaxID=1008152 RepID=A0AAV3UFF7_9EURY|nr:conditioned medium-induced protein 4 [Haladaptatus pallidirubidus]
MDKKTEELRDIFMDVTDEETVTEKQAETHGSLGSEEKVNERLRDVIEEMRGRYDFGTSLSDDELATVVRQFSAGKEDNEIADELGDASLGETVFRARIDLHLFRESDTDAPFDIADLKDCLVSEMSVADCADQLDTSESTVRRYQRIIEAKDEARSVNQQYTNEFENILQDRELSDRMTQDIQQDGLEDATEGMESNVSF